MTTQVLEKIISAAMLRTRMRSPFFATLQLYMRYLEDDKISVTATNGFDVFYNKERLSKMPVRQLDAMIIHQVLHASFLHLVYRGERDEVLWNAACEIVVNGVIAKQDFLELPPGSIRETSLETKPIEEIYELISKKKDTYQAQLKHICLLGGYRQSESHNFSEGTRRNAEYEAYWREAMQQAQLVQRIQKNNLPPGVEKILQYIAESQIDWRAALWRFLVRTPADFAEFDRRFVGRGLYLEDSKIDSVQVYLCVDTGSGVDNDQLRTFLQEVRSVLKAYPHLEEKLYFADETLSAPHQVTEEEILLPVGNGNSLYSAIFEQIERDRLPDSKVVCIYLTDGFGVFPDKLSDVPILWVVTPGGRELEQFPFGEAVRFLQAR